MPAILLSDLLGHEVYAEQQRIGYVSDVRFVLRDDTTTGGFARAERADVYGLVVSRTRRVSHLGFERSQVNSPWLIARLERRLHRGTILILWQDVISIGPRILLRPGFRQQSPVLRQPVTADAQAD